MRGKQNPLNKNIRTAQGIFPKTPAFPIAPLKSWHRISDEAQAEWEDKISEFCAECEEEQLVLIKALWEYDKPITRAELYKAVYETDMDEEEFNFNLAMIDYYRYPAYDGTNNAVWDTDTGEYLPGKSEMDADKRLYQWYKETHGITKQLLEILEEEIEDLDSEDLLDILQQS